MSFLRDTLRSAAGTAVLTVGRFVGMAVIARTLDVEAFGVLVVAMLWVDLVSRSALFGLGAVYTRFAAVARDDEMPGFQRLRARWFAISCVFALLVSPVLGLVHLGLEADGLVLFVGWVLLTTVRLMANTRMVGAFRFDLVPVASALDAGVLILTAFLVVQPDDLSSAMLALALTALAYALPSLILMNRPGTQVPSDTDRKGLPERREILHYGFNSWLTGFTSILVLGRGELMVVEGLMSARDLGLYGAALTLMGMVWRVLTMLTGATIPHLSRCIDDPDRRDAFVTATTRISLTASAVAALAFALLGREMSVLAFGVAFADSAVLLAWLAPGAVAAGMVVPNITVQFLSNGVMTRNMMIAGSFALLVLAWVLVGLADGAGAALARTFTMLGLGAAAGLWLVARRVGTLGRWILVELGVTVAVAAVASALVLLAEPPLAVRAVLCAALSYALMIRATGQVMPQRIARTSIAMLRGL